MARAREGRLRASVVRAGFGAWGGVSWLGVFRHRRIRYVPLRETAAVGRPCEMAWERGGGLPWLGLCRHRRVRYVPLRETAKAGEIGQSGGTTSVSVDPAFVSRKGERATVSCRDDDGRLGPRGHGRSTRGVGCTSCQRRTDTAMNYRRCAPGALRYVELRRLSGEGLRAKCTQPSRPSGGATRAGRSAPDRSTAGRQMTRPGAGPLGGRRTGEPGRRAIAGPERHGRDATVVPPPAGAGAQKYQGKREKSGLRFSRNASRPSVASSVI